jgi:hypothetical protein
MDDTTLIGMLRHMAKDVMLPFRGRHSHQPNYIHKESLTTMEDLAKVCKQAADRLDALTEKLQMWENRVKDAIAGDKK